MTRMTTSSAMLLDALRIKSLDKMQHSSAAQPGFFVSCCMVYLSKLAAATCQQQLIRNCNLLAVPEWEYSLGTASSQVLLCP